MLDLFLLNETHRPVDGRLKLSFSDADGRTTDLGVYPVPPYVQNQFAYLVAESVAVKAPAAQGHCDVCFDIEGSETAQGRTRIFLVDPAPKRDRILHAGICGDAEKFMAFVPNGALTAERMVDGNRYDLAVWLADGSDAPPGVLERVRRGLPLLVLAQNAKGVDIAAQALAGANALVYAGPVGESRGCWMGNWVFIKEHPAYDALPVNQVMKSEYQVAFDDASGLMIDGPGIEVIAGYFRDHDTNLGAATFSASCGEGRVLFQAVRGMHPLIYERFIVNSARMLCGLV